MKKQYKLLFLLWILLLAVLDVQAQMLDPNPIQLQSMVKSAIAKGYAASVFITQYDTVANRQTAGRFSGVVVTEDGVIITAAHATKPNEAYWVTFPDGREFPAIGIGRIASLDAAMIKITVPGKYPHAEMGWSSSMKINEPCISIAYPGSLTPQRAMIRLGVVVAHGTQRAKMMQTTCLMEPGDSGGPVFDLYGRVVGIRSNILESVTENFDVPVDNFRKYWSSLLKPVDYKVLPVPDSLTIDPLVDKRTSFTSRDKFKLSLVKQDLKLEKNVVQIVDGSGKAIVLGTLINPSKFSIDKGLARQSYVISKNSLVTNEVNARVGDQIFKGKIIYRDKVADLALISLGQQINEGLVLKAFQTDTVKFSDLGSILITPFPSNSSKVGVVGTLTFDLPNYGNSGFLGAIMDATVNKIMVKDVMANSAAANAGLKSGDELVSLNGRTFSSPEEMINEIRKNSVGDTIKFVMSRNGETNPLSIKLGKRPSVPITFADRYEGGQSKVYDGFKRVFAYDGLIMPAECGSPVFDLQGDFRGINMARFSRTTNVVVSPAEVLKFLKMAFTALTSDRKNMITS
jgi:serine protease Do